MELFLVSVLTISLVVSVSPASSKVEYPQVKTVDTVDNLSIDIADPYRWLEDLSSEETSNYIEKQNALSDPFLSALPMVTWFDQQIQELSGNGVVGRPTWFGDRWVTRVANSDSTITWMAQKTLEEAPATLVTQEQLNVDGNIRWYSLSPDGRIFAFSVVVDGGDLEEIRFFDIETGQLLATTLSGIKFNYPKWAPNSSGLFYSRYLKPGNEFEDGIDREPVIAYHQIGSDQSTDHILHQVDDGDGAGNTFGVSVDNTGQYLLTFYVNFQNFSYQYFIHDLGTGVQPVFTNPIQSLDVDPSSQISLIGLVNERLLLQVKDNNNSSGQIVAIKPDDVNNIEIVIASSETVLTNTYLVNDFLITDGKVDVKSQLRVFALDGSYKYSVPLPAPGSVFGITAAEDKSDIHFGFDAFAYPFANYRFNVNSQELTALNRSTADIKSDDYISKQVFITSTGGAQIPVFITHKKDISLPAPTYLNVYGLPGWIQEPVFSPQFAAWMKAGGILASVNVRGGSAYGPEWEAAGMLQQRHNTHDDFINAAEYLIGANYTSNNKLAIAGVSGGGMVVTAVSAKRPELFAAVVPSVPVTDLIRFAKYTAGARLKSIMGDPSIPEQLPWLLSWSPYQNLYKGLCYPATLVDTAVDDDLVHPSQSYKYVAKLQAYQGCDNPVMLTVSADGGHYGSLDPVVARQNNAKRLAFMAKMTGLKEP